MMVVGAEQMTQPALGTVIGVSRLSSVPCHSPSFMGFEHFQKAHRGRVQCGVCVCDLEMGAQLKTAPHTL